MDPQIKALLEDMASAWNSPSPSAMSESTCAIFCETAAVLLADFELGELGPLIQPSTVTATGEDLLRSKPDFHADPVEQLAFELAMELEDAELSPSDLVTVNQAKLRAIAERVLVRFAPPATSPVTGALVEALAEIEAAMPTTSWVVSQGRGLLSSPPFRVQIRFGSMDVIGDAEDHDPAKAAHMALAAALAAQKAEG